MITKEEYKKTFIRMMDSIRTEYKSELNCRGVDCADCPICHLCNNFDKLAMAFELIEAVEQWGKEHPVITNTDKFKEVFGREPRTERNGYICPCICDGYPVSKNCYDCKREFWESEYKAPEKEEEQC